MVEETLSHEPSVLAIPEGHPFARLDALTLVAARRRADGRAQPRRSPRGLSTPCSRPPRDRACDRGSSSTPARRRKRWRSSAPASACTALPASAVLPHRGVVYREIEDAPSRTSSCPAARAARAARSRRSPRSPVTLFIDADNASNDGGGASGRSARPRTSLPARDRFGAAARCGRRRDSRALALLWQASRRAGVLAVVFVLAEGALPVLVLIAMGRVTGAIPGAADVRAVLARRAPADRRARARRRDRTRCR